MATNTISDALRLAYVLSPFGSLEIRVGPFSIRRWPSTEGEPAEEWWSESHDPDEGFAARLFDREQSYREDGGLWLRHHAPTAEAALDALCEDLRTRVRSEAERFADAAKGTT